jgi:hypothetical protein
MRSDIDRALRQSMSEKVDEDTAVALAFSFEEQQMRADIDRALRQSMSDEDTAVALAFSFEEQQMRADIDRALRQSMSEKVDDDTGLALAFSFEDLKLDHGYFSSPSTNYVPRQTKSYAVSIRDSDVALRAYERFAPECENKREQPEMYMPREPISSRHEPIMYGSSSGFSVAQEVPRQDVDLRLFIEDYENFSRSVFAPECKNKREQPEIYMPREPISSSGFPVTQEETRQDEHSERKAPCFSFERMD